MLQLREFGVGIAVAAQLLLTDASEPHFCQVCKLSVSLSQGFTDAAGASLICRPTRNCCCRGRRGAVPQSAFGHRKSSSLPIRFAPQETSCVPKTSCMVHPSE